MPKLAHNVSKELTWLKMVLANHADQTATNAQAPRTVSAAMKDMFSMTVSATHAPTEIAMYVMFSLKNHASIAKINIMSWRMVHAVNAILDAWNVLVPVGARNAVMVGITKTVFVLRNVWPITPLPFW